MMALEQFLSRLDRAEEVKSLYCKGAFGAPCSPKNKSRYTSNHTYNMQISRREKIVAASADTYLMDCVCMIKGILWGWRGDSAHVYGGAVYLSNGVPDVGADSIINYCPEIRTDVANAPAGALLWMPGHVGISRGDGTCTECTPSFKDGVCRTKLSQRPWRKWGLLPWVDYGSLSDLPRPTATVTVVKGDTLSGIGKRLGVPWREIAAANGITAPWRIFPGQELLIP